MRRDFVSVRLFVGLEMKRTETDNFGDLNYVMRIPY